METGDWSVTKVAFAYARTYRQGQVLRVQRRHYFGLTLVLSGSLRILLEDREVTADAGEILLQRAGDSYLLEATAEEGAEYLVISYDAAPRESLLAYLPVRRFVPERPNRYRELFFKAVQVSEERGVCADSYLRALVQELLCRIIREQSAQAPREAADPVTAARWFVEKHFASPLSVGQIAAAVGLSESHLRSLFRRARGEPPVRYLNRVRVERAKEMLTSGQFSMEEIAVACGFQNEYYFSRVFKEFTGVPPGRY
ncbi:MAG: helix-turn-helix transcriptional regulator [Clostridia bacterium]|nr:helix-turn-helix transcriptional regulator [Clostridia bacterium]